MLRGTLWCRRLVVAHLFQSLLKGMDPEIQKDRVMDWIIMLGDPRACLSKAMARAWLAQFNLNSFRIKFRHHSYVGVAGSEIYCLGKEQKEFLNPWQRPAAMVPRARQTS